MITPTADVMEPIELERNHLEEQKKYYTPEAWAKIEQRIKKPMFPDAEQILENNKIFIALAYKAGCILTLGTDQVGLSLLPGFAIWREAEIFSEAGVKPMDILKAATCNGAYAIGRSDLIGAIDSGKLADFVALDANPLEDISNLRKVHRVVKGGILYEPAKLLQPFVGKVH